MGFARFYECDSGGCDVKTRPEAFAATSGPPYEGLPAGWVLIKEGEHGRENTFHGLLCASEWLQHQIDREVRAAAQSQLTGKATP